MTTWLISFVRPQYSYRHIARVGPDGHPTLGDVISAAATGLSCQTLCGQQSVFRAAVGSERVCWRCQNKQDRAARKGKGGAA